MDTHKILRMTKEEFLKQAAEKTGTDKSASGHNYIPTYAKYLPDTCTSLLEIGIAEGRSAIMWDMFYGKDKLDLHYIDLFQNPDFVSQRWCRNRGIVAHTGSQADLPFIATIQDQFQIIVDDGSHVAAHQLISFKHLFPNNLKPGGIYFIEDCHLNKDSFYYGEGVQTYIDTPVSMFKYFIETGRIVNLFFNEGESEIFQNLIESVHIEVEEKLIIIKRKQ